MKRASNSIVISRQGFTLLETLVALVILATGIVSILLLFPIAMERHRTSTLRTMTTTISQTKLGELRAGDTDASFHVWLEENRLGQLAANVPEGQYIQSWSVVSQPMGEVGHQLHRVTLRLRLWDNRVEYYTTYVTDR